MIVVGAQPLKHFVFIQTVASSSWVIDHNLNRYPGVTVIDSAGNLIEGSIKYVSPDRVVLEFSEALSGLADLN